MRILITGASGFVGQHLAAALSANHEIFAAVRHAGTAPVNTTERVIDAIDGTTEWSEALKGIDTVVHLAARVHVMHESADDPLTEYRTVNTAGTQRLAEACATSEVRRFIFMSSIKVNGERTTGAPFAAQDAAAPMDPYGVSKMEAEEAIARIRDVSSLEAVILRSPVVYGPGVGGNIRRIGALVERGLPLPLGSVHNRRTMLSVGNLIRWVEYAISSDSPLESPVLMGDPLPVSTPELIRYLARGMGRSARLLPTPTSILIRLGRLIGRGADVSRLVEDLEIAVDSQLAERLDLQHPEIELTALGRSLATTRGTRS